MEHIIRLANDTNELDRQRAYGQIDRCLRTDCELKVTGGCILTLLNKTQEERGPLLTVPSVVNLAEACYNTYADQAGMQRELAC